MLQELLPATLKGSAALLLLWSPRTLITSFSTPIPSLPFLSDLNLTLAQQQRLQCIRLNTQARLKEVLTPEQSRNYKVTLWQNRDLPTALQAMNLSGHQQHSLIEIFSYTHQQIQSLLTLTQQHQWEQLICDRLNSQLWVRLSEHQPIRKLSTTF